MALIQCKGRDTVEAIFLQHVPQYFSYHGPLSQIAASDCLPSLLMVKNGARTTCGGGIQTNEVIYDRRLSLTWNWSDCWARKIWLGPGDSLAVQTANTIWRESKKRNMTRSEMEAPMGRNSAWQVSIVCIPVKTKKKTNKQMRHWWPSIRVIIEQWKVMLLALINTNDWWPMNISFGAWMGIWMWLSSTPELEWMGKRTHWQAGM